MWGGTGKKKRGQQPTTGKVNQTPAEAGHCNRQPPPPPRPPWAPSDAHAGRPQLRRRGAVQGRLPPLRARPGPVAGAWGPRPRLPALPVLRCFEPRENAAPNVNAVSSPKFPFPGMLMTKSQHGFFGGGAFSYPKSHPHYCHKPWSEVPEQNQNASGERRDKAGGVAVKPTKVILVP